MYQGQQTSIPKEDSIKEEEEPKEPEKPKAAPPRPPKIGKVDGSSRPRPHYSTYDYRYCISCE